MKKLLLLSLTILLFSCRVPLTEDLLNNTKRYNIPNSLKEQIMNADCEELEVLREEFKFKLKNHKDLRPLNRKSFLGIPSARDSVYYLSRTIYYKRKELKCRKKLKEARKLSR